MGLEIHAIRFILEARARGVSFDHVLTLGRQNVHADPEPIAAACTAAGVRVSAGEVERLLREGDGFCEPLLGRLGAAAVSSIDASAYQRASIVHDLNRPLPAEWHQRFSLVVDGGTLEHVFNFPQAIANSMQAIRPGGHFIATTPANNFTGHGFYQFSPEVYYRVFSPENGFEVERMIAYEDRWPSDWYEVEDPAVVGRRVTLVNRVPTLLLVLARRREAVPIFRTFPQQSDYVRAWTDTAPGPPRAAPSSRRTAVGDLAVRAARALARMAPARLKARYHDWRAGGADRFDPSCYRKLGRR